MANKTLVPDPGITLDPVISPAPSVPIPGVNHQLDRVVHVDDLPLLDGGGVPSPSVPDPVPSPADNDNSPDSSTPSPDLVPGSDLWAPDPNKSPEDNLNSLMAYISSLFHFSLQDAYDFTSQPRIFADMLYHSYNIISSYFGGYGPFGDLDNGTKVSLAEKMADIYQHYIDSVYSQAMNYQSWYLQQEYNSPINQINRLTEAGLSSSFIFGGLSSGNASSPASTPNLDQVQSSGAGQIQQQYDASRNSLFGSLFGGIFGGLSGLVSAGGGFFLDVAKGKTVNALRPYELADLGASIVGKSVTQQYQQSQMDQIRQNMAFQVMDQELSYGQQELQTAGQAVDTAQSSYQTDWNNYTREYTETAYQVQVKDSSGNTKSYTLSEDQVENAIRNGGKVGNDLTIVGSETWNQALSASGSVGSDVDIIPFVASANVSGSVTNTDSSGGSRSESRLRKNETYHDILNNSKSSSVGYSEDGKSFHIGSTQFTSVTNRYRLPLPEYKRQIEAKYQRYQEALDRYNTLSAGQQSRCLRILQELTDNLSQFSSGAVNAYYSDKIKRLTEPRVMVAD